MTAGWPVTVAGRSWNAADFEAYGYVKNLPLLLQGTVQDVAAKVAVADGHARAAEGHAAGAGAAATMALGAADIVEGHAVAAGSAAASAGQSAATASSEAAVAGDHAAAALTASGASLAAAGSAATAAAVAGDHAASALGSVAVAGDHAASANVASLAAAGSAIDAADHQARAAHWADLAAQAAATAVWMPGDIKLSAVTSPPVGWLACDGAAMDRAVYAALFAAIGTVYGEGDGATTFNLPDLRGRVPVGVGDGGDPLVSVAPGQRFGQSQVELSVPLPEHNHAAVLEVTARAVIATSDISIAKSYTPLANSVLIQPTLPNANLYTRDTSGDGTYVGHPVADLTIGPDDAVKGTASGEVMGAGVADATIIVPLQPPSIGLVYLIKT